MSYEPSSTNNMISSSYYVLSCDKKLITTNPEALYQNGICPHCHTGIGSRGKDVVRQLSGTSNDDVIFTSNGLYVHFLFSASFRDFLVSGGIDISQFAPALDEKGTAFFELCPNSIPIPFVGIVDELGDRAKAVYCPRCQKQNFIVYHKSFSPEVCDFIRESDSGRLGFKISIVGWPDALVPLFSEEFVRLAKAKKIKRIAFQKIGIVRDIECQFPLSGCSPISQR